MANIQSKIKRNRQNEKRRLRNRNIRGSARTAVNQARAAFAKNAPETSEAVLQAISEVDKSAGKGVIHANKAARLKSRLMKRLTAMGGSVAKKPDAAPAESAEPKKKTRSKKSESKYLGMTMGRCASLPFRATAHRWKSAASSVPRRRDYSSRQS